MLFESVPDLLLKPNPCPLTLLAVSGVSHNDGHVHPACEQPLPLSSVPLRILGPRSYRLGGEGPGSRLI